MVSALVVIAASALVALTLLGAAFALIGRGLDLGPFVLAAVAEVTLLVQLVVVVVRLAMGDRPDSPALVLSYLVTAVLILPVGAFWALGERSRWSNGIMAIAGGGVAAMVARLWDLWPGVSGPGRLLVAVYAIFAVAATSRAVYQLVTKAGEAPVAYALSAAAAGIYVVATVALARPGTRARAVATVAVAVELVGVVVVGGLSLLRPEWFPDDTVWSRFGLGYGLIPLVLPILALWWLRSGTAAPAPDRGAR